MKIMPISMPKDIDKYFFNRIKDINMINTQLSTVKFDIPPQLLITGYRGVGKTFLLRKVLNDQINDILTAFIDLSEIMGRQKGNLTEEKVLKSLLNAIDETISQNKKSYKKWIGKITSTIKKLELKNYDFSDNVNVFDIPIPVISDNYDKLFDLLKPVRYKYIDGASDRYHTGFIAQEVVKALEQSNLTTKDFAAVMLTNDIVDGEKWRLRRDEFVALNTWQIQKLKARVAELEKKIESLQ